MKNMFRPVAFGVVAVSFLVIGLIVASNLSLTPATEARTEALWTEGVSSASSGQPGSFADLAEEFSPAVVNISTATVIKEGEAPQPFGGGGGRYQVQSISGEGPGNF